MFVVFYTVNLYMCINDMFNPTVFMIHLWIHGIYIHIYISVCVCLCVCVCVCVCNVMNYLGSGRKL